MKSLLNLNSLNLPRLQPDDCIMTLIYFVQMPSLPYLVKQNEPRCIRILRSIPHVMDRFISIGSKKKKSKKANMLRCALCSSIPLGVIGLCAIMFGVVQLVLRNILHEIGFTLIGVGGLLILVATFLCLLVAYLLPKLKRREENEWKLQVNGDLSTMTAQT